MTIHVILFAVGLALLWQGSEILVKGSSKLAVSLGIKPIIVGFTIVAMGTSSPELAVSLFAAVRDNMEISLGNIVGSNIANIGLVVGICALIRPIQIRMESLRHEIPIMVISGIIFTVFAYDGLLSRIDGLIMLIGFVIFILLTIDQAQKEKKTAEYLPVDTKDNNFRQDFLFISFGFIGLIGGSYLTMQTSVNIATALGVQPVVIAISMIAVGTSLPELAISSVASIKGKSELAIGNAIGSNIFNTLFVIATVAMIHPIAVPKELFKLQFPAMLIFTLVSVPMMWTKFKLSRGEGLILLVLYGYFIWLLY